MSSNYEFLKKCFIYVEIYVFCVSFTNFDASESFKGLDNFTGYNIRKVLNTVVSTYSVVR